MCDLSTRVDINFLYLGFTETFKQDIFFLFLLLLHAMIIACFYYNLNVVL